MLLFLLTNRNIFGVQISQLRFIILLIATLFSYPHFPFLSFKTMSTASACLPLTASRTTTKTSTSRAFAFNTRKSNFNSVTCRASSFKDINIDLYDLLGIDSTSNQSQIKNAYRSLQKRCHPDIAGPAGHDMAIILNEVYSFLSDPTSRSAYDKVNSFCKYYMNKK